MKGMTLGEFRKMTSHLDDDTPLLILNPVGRGSNEFDCDDGTISIGKASVSQNGFAHSMIDAEDWDFVPKVVDAIILMG